MIREGSIRSRSLLLVLAAAATVCAASTQALGTFTPPGPYPAGIDFVSGGLGGDVIYHVDNYEGSVYSITTGGDATLLFKISESVGHPFTYYHGNGICFVPSKDLRSGTFYITRADRGVPPYEDYVRSFTLDGTFLHEYDVSAIVDRPYGITFDGTYFWLSSDGGFVKCDTDFNMVQQYVPPWGTGNGALDFDPSTGYLYSAGLGWAYMTVMDLECNSVYQWYLNDHYRVGVAVGPVNRPTPGRTLWIVDNTSVVIEEIEDVYYTPAEEASWSAIKAMFR